MGVILVGFDGSEPSRRAVEHAAARAQLGSDEVVLLHVIPQGVAKSSLSGMMPAGIELPKQLGRTFEENARALMEDAIRAHAAKGVRIRGEVRVGETVQALVAAVGELKAEELVIGHKSFESGDVSLGPVAERLLRDLPATVTVVR